MGAQDSGLSLEGLAQRLEALERENERMRSENAELRHKMATREGSETGRAVEETTESRLEGQVSRRALLSKAGVAAAGLAVAGALTQRDIREAKAAQVIGDSDQQFRGGVEGSNTNSFGYGVMGRAPNSGWGVDGEGGQAGVRGHSTTGYGVEGSTTSSARAGVFGNGDTGVVGRSNRNDFQGVYGQHTGTVGYGVVGDGTGPGAGVLARNASGSGVQGEGRYGGKFVGNRAQLLLVPKGTTGKPTGAHTKGEIYMDSAGTLFVCTASGTPGTWRKVTTTAA